MDVLLVSSLYGTGAKLIPPAINCRWPSRQSERQRSFSHSVQHVGSGAAGEPHSLRFGRVSLILRVRGPSQVPGQQGGKPGSEDSPRRTQCVGQGDGHSQLSLYHDCHRSSILLVRPPRGSAGNLGLGKIRQPFGFDSLSLQIPLRMKMYLCAYVCMEAYMCNMCISLCLCVCIYGIYIYICVCVCVCVA